MVGDRAGARALVFLGALVFPGQAVHAQDQPDDGRLGFRAALQGNFVPIYGGDATVGGESSLGISARAGADLEEFITIEATATLLPSPTHALSSITYLGAAGRLSLVKREYPVRVFLSAGVAQIRYQGEDRTPCEPPECFSEGGPSFPVESEVSPVVGVGANVVFDSASPFSLLADLRWHMTRPLRESGLVAGVGVELEFR